MTVLHNPQEVLGKLVIGPYSALPLDYDKMLNAAETLDALKAGLEHYKPVASDAVEIVATWTPADFERFRRALHKEKSGKDSQDESAYVVILPAVIFEVALIAAQFIVPWGVAYHRMRQLGLLRIRKGIVQVVKKKGAK